MVLRARMTPVTGRGYVRSLNLVGPPKDSLIKVNDDPVVCERHGAALRRQSGDACGPNPEERFGLSARLWQAKESRHFWNVSASCRRYAMPCQKHNRNGVNSF